MIEAIEPCFHLFIVLKMSSGFIFILFFFHFRFSFVHCLRYDSKLTWIEHFDGIQTIFMFMFMFIDKYVPIVFIYLLITKSRIQLKSTFLYRTQYCHIDRIVYIYIVKSIDKMDNYFN